MSIYKGRKRKEKINTIRRLVYYLKLLFITRVEYALNESAKGNVHQFYAKVIPYESSIGLKSLLNFEILIIYNYVFYK